MRVYKYVALINKLKQVIDGKYGKKCVSLQIN